MPSDPVQVNIRLAAALVQRIDQIRGDVPRNKWIIRTMEQATTEIDLPNTPDIVTVPVQVNLQIDSRKLAHGVHAAIKKAKGN